MGCRKFLSRLAPDFFSLKILVLGFNGPGRTRRQITKETFVLLDQFDGQSKGFVREGGTLILHYGSQGFAFEIKWIDDSFERKG
jgi:hypothetical protein